MRTPVILLVLFAHVGGWGGVVVQGGGVEAGGQRVVGFGVIGFRDQVNVDWVGFVVGGGGGYWRILCLLLSYCLNFNLS